VLTFELLEVEQSMYDETGLFHEFSCSGHPGVVPTLPCLLFFTALFFHLLFLFTHYDDLDPPAVLMPPALSSMVERLTVAKRFPRRNQ
jgi:hypothetical protein